MEKRIERIYNAFLKSGQKISTDTRKISTGSLFFALPGENFNGNDYAHDAINKGAAFAIVDNKNLTPHEQLIFTDSVLKTLQQLSNFHRNQLKIKVIALTGSNGKTTTKELINAVLNQKFKTYSTQGNLNNHIGVPLTLLSLTSFHEYAVVEMGANHQHEIELLCKIAEPDFGLITNIGKAHLEGFGGFEGVKRGKGELYDFLKKTSGKIFLHADNIILNDMCGDYKHVITYGNRTSFDCIGTTFDTSSPYLGISWRSKNDSETNFISSHLTGSYNFENILAATCIGNYFGVEKELIRKGIESYIPSNLRSQLIEKNSNTFILDYYNANPSSMEAAVMNFDKNFTGKKIAIIGDMLELGNESEREHQQIVDLISKINFSETVYVGKNFGKLDKNLNAKFFETSDAAKEWIQKQNFKNSFILIKGSRGLKMEKVMEAFEV